MATIPDPDDRPEQSVTAETPALAPERAPDGPSEPAQGAANSDSGRAGTAPAGDRPRPDGAAPAVTPRDPASGAAGGAVVAPTATEPREPRRERNPRRDGGRYRGAREKPFERGDREKQSSGSRRGEHGDARPRGPGRPRDGRGPHGRGRERDRDERRKKPEPKLYRMEAIVDRGFEDVPDPATEGATRRVDWTILKRTTTDQNTARTVAAIYVLRRDGVDTEFPHLGAAREAVNKRIVHPEKLTLSKADHAAARGAKK